MTGDTNNFSSCYVLVFALLKETLVNEIHLADFKLGSSHGRQAMSLLSKVEFLLFDITTVVFAKFIYTSLSSN